jgi:hypothetical protein
MAIVPIPGASEKMSTMSARSLFYALFFGLSGGMLFMIIFLGVIYWRCIRSGRIRLGAGGPGEFDDEQRLLEEEQAAMQNLDPAQQEAYYRAKG